MIFDRKITLRNFKPIESYGIGFDREVHAEVDVTTGWFWPFTSTERRRIMRRPFAFWAYLDTGEPTPGLQAEDLERDWERKHRVEI
jgi:hypothetical protein